MMFNIPIPDGSTGHMVGGAVVACVLGPWAAVLALPAPGTDPAAALSITDALITTCAPISTAPLPRGVDEMILAGFIRRKPVAMVKGVTVDIEVPAEAEFVLEGYVDPEETRVEGPFGDHTGYYSLEDLYPVFHVTAVTHRRNPIYSATIVGRPPMEDCYLALATERLFLPMIKTLMPEIKDYWLPWEGVFHNIVVAAIEKEYPQHAAKIISGLWGTGQMSFAKAIVVVDDRSLLSDGKRLLEHILNTVDFHSDITVAEGILDVLDHSAPQPLYGAKIAVDATARIEKGFLLSNARCTSWVASSTREGVAAAATCAATVADMVSASVIKIVLDNLKDLS